MTSLKQRTLSGILWSSAARVGQQGLHLAITVVLARLLAPEDFGLIAMVLVFTGFAALFAEFGFSAALVQRPEIDEAHTSTIFWFNLAVGAVLTGIFFLSAPVFAWFYSAPDLLPLTQAFALSFSITAFGIVPSALLQRRMEFRGLARIEIVAAGLSGAAAVVMAVNGLGVWSLVGQSLLAHAITVVLVFRASGWGPRFIWSSPALLELLRFSIHLFGFKFINYWARNADNLLIGKLIGSAGLGIYSKAYALMLLPITQVIAVVGRVMFPAMSMIQTDIQRTKRVYLRAMRLIALITFPMMTGLFVVAEPFVRVLLGEQWLAVVPILQLLCLVGIMQTLTNPTGWIYQSQGRTDWMFRWGVGGAGALIIAIGIGAHLGSITTVAWAYVLANLVLFYPCILIPGRLIGLRVAEVVREVTGVLACACSMAGIVWAARTQLPAAWPPAGQLLPLVLIGCLSYLALLVVIRPLAFEEAKELILQRRAWLGAPVAEDPQGEQRTLPVAAPIAARTKPAEA